MSSDDFSAQVQPLPDTEQARLEVHDLAAQQVEQIDPIGWSTVQRLLDQAESAPEALRTQLLARLHQRLRGLREQVHNARTTAMPQVADEGPCDEGANTPSLSTLVATLLPGAATPLQTLAPMRQLHARLKIRQQLRQTLAQPLRHAGPLHSERLVQQSLTRLNGLSQAYLNRFMAHLDALATLDNAQSLTRFAPAAGRAQPRAKVKAPLTTRL